MPIIFAILLPAVIFIKPRIIYESKIKGRDKRELEHNSKMLHGPNAQ